ncbi:MAG: hypothetical protein NXY57DRAFT_958505 [Lentinula lateritia]|nr:MAG: hypothetical protein NXY57DRAFT_958505 [Lentinula lateritia]
MFPASSSSTLNNRKSSQHMLYDTHNGLKSRRYSDTEEFHPHEISHLSPLPSSPMLSPAIYPDGPQQHSRSPHYVHSSTYLSPNPGYSRRSSYTQRPSSPSTASSSPPPVTSPLIAFTRLNDDHHYAYASRVQIVGRDANESDLVRDGQYDEDVRYFSQNDEDDLRPKLPSFRSLFGKSKRYDSLAQRPEEEDLRIRTYSSPISSPSLEATLPPLKISSVIRPKPDVTSSYTLQPIIRTSIPSTPQHIKGYTETDVIKLQDNYTRNRTLSRTNAAFGPVLLDLESTIPIHTISSHISHQTPTRRKNPFSDTDTPSTSKDTEIIFFSPSKVSPFPRRTYFQESSERERCTPEPVNVRYRLNQLVEIADMANPDFSEAKVDVLQQSPDQTEEALYIDSATSPLSSPSAYLSSLPPSSPPTPEAQLSPLMHGNDLSITTATPLTDVMNLTAEPRVDVDCLGLQGIESHKSLNPVSDEVSQLEDNSFPTSAHTQDPIVTNYVVEAVDDDDHPFSPAGAIDLELNKVAATLDTEDLAPELNQNTESQNSSSQVIDDRGPYKSSSNKDEPPPASISSESKLLPTSADSVQVLSVASYPSTSTSALQASPKQLPAKSKNKTKMKSTSSAPSISSSAPRVTVTVVKRMRPVPKTHHIVNEASVKKGTSMSIKGKEKGTSKTKPLDSHSSSSKRDRTSQTASKGKVLDDPPRKKLKLVTEEYQTNTASKSLPSSLAEAICTSFDTSNISIMESLSIVPAKRKVSHEIPSPEISNLSAHSSTISSKYSPALPSHSSNPQKRLRTVPVELPVPSKDKSSSPTDNNTWVDENWVDAVATAYGSPHPSPQILRRKAIATTMPEIGSIEDEDDNERQSLKAKSLRSPHKRIVIESESEEDDDEVEKRLPVRQSSRQVVDSDSASEQDVKLGRPSKSQTSHLALSDDLESSESELTDYDESEAVDEEAGEEDEEDEEEVPTKEKNALGSNHQKPKSSLSSLSPFDLELVGIIVETMSLSRSSSHLALSLYKTMRETRNSVFAQLMKANWAHLDVVTKELRSKGLCGHVSGNQDDLPRRGRPKRNTPMNEEGGTAGMSETDIMWVSEFERVMTESADRYGMFGMVESSFRNESRNLPLPFSSRFFYVPDCDPDVERAQLIRLTMPGSGKRSETKKYKQYYWKPVGK